MFPGTNNFMPLPRMLSVLVCEVKVAQSYPALQPHGLYSPWNSPGLNTGVSSLSFLQGIFPSQGLNSGLPQCGQIFYQLSHQGSPRILEWEAYPFSRGSSQPSNWTGVSCIAGSFFTNWATREALRPCKDKYKLKRKYFKKLVPLTSNFSGRGST